MPGNGRSKANQTEAAETGRLDSPRIVFRDGVAYLDEYDIPIWRLEMGRHPAPVPPQRSQPSPV